MDSKILIVCISSYRGNTIKIAKEIGKVLNSKVVSPEEASKLNLKGYDVIGFGSGIFFKKHHDNILNFIRNSDLKDKKTFIISTRANIFLGSYHKPIKDLLKEKGATVIGEFSKPAFDGTGPFALINGVHKGRPHEGDLLAAEKFARNLNLVKPEIDLIKENKVKASDSLNGVTLYTPANKNYTARIYGTKTSVDWNKCIGCKQCILNCPLSVFDLVKDNDKIEKPLPTRELDCINCKTCIKSCKNNAITLHATWKDGFRIAWRHRNR